MYRFSEGPTTQPADRAQHVYCTCRCGVPANITVEASVLCSCPDGFSCVSLAGPQYNPGVQGSYCVRVSTGGGGG